MEAAGETFAEVGFRDAKVRDICQRADANIAAINYHFGDKEHLYDAVIRYAHRCSTEHTQPSEAGDRSASDRLRDHINGFLRRLFDDGRPAWQAKLMAREMVEPTKTLDALVEMAVRPQFEALKAIVAELLPASASPETVRFSVISVVAQCLHYHHGRAVMSRLFTDDLYTPDGIRRLGEHIARFSLAALACMAAEDRGGGSARGPIGEGGR